MPRIRVLSRRLHLPSGLAIRGDVVDIADWQVDRLVELGWAEAVHDPPLATRYDDTEGDPADPMTATGTPDDRGDDPHGEP